MKSGDLIAVDNNLYDYIGYDEEIKMHKVAVVDIDEEGYLTNTHIPWYFTDKEISNTNIELTEAQWLGVVEHLIRQDYDFNEEEISEAAEDIVCRCFVVTGIPKFEELIKYIYDYMNR